MTIFDSRKLKYKSPFGAVVCGTAVTFTVTPPAEFTGCTLLTFGEFADVRQETALLPCDGGFSGVFSAPAAPELVWYTFRLTRRDGSALFLGRNGLGDEGDRQPWQLTVYEDRPTPDWFGRGVTYQIFPDRFRRTALPDPRGLLGERTVHENWHDAPRTGADPRTGRWNSDFFGGNLRGICEKLDYLRELSVTTIYLNPIFYAASSHRYDTADYLTIDPMLGNEADLRTLCDEARKRGIHVILDGVFNHTGDDSRYFNRSGFFPTSGAYQSKNSPWYDWFCFQQWPDIYDAWWGIGTLPAVNENAPAYRDFIIRGQDSVIRRWLRCGADGWRLDVADELPDGFIEKIRRVIEEEKADGYLLGEVWEDGTTKVAYSQRRKYLLGHETHGLMNYPFRTALMNYLRGGDAEDFREQMETLRENYPAPAFYGALNFLSTHDTPRLLTLLGLQDDAPATRDERAVYRLKAGERAHAMALLKLAALILYTFPGSPMLYYGDEAGMEGFEDPFNRGTYPWGHEDEALLRYFRQLGALRGNHEALQGGTIRYHAAEGRALAFERGNSGDRCLTAVNAGAEPLTLTLPWEGTLAIDALTQQRFFCRDGILRLTLEPFGALLLTEGEK